MAKGLLHDINWEILGKLNRPCSMMDSDDEEHAVLDYWKKNILEDEDDAKKIEDSIKGLMYLTQSLLEYDSYVYYKEHILNYFYSFFVFSF